MKISKVFSNGLNPSIKKSLFIFTLVLFSCGVCVGGDMVLDPFAFLDAKKGLSVQFFDDDEELFFGRLDLADKATSASIEVGFFLNDPSLRRLVNGDYWVYLKGRSVGQFVVFDSQEFCSYKFFDLPLDASKMHLKAVYSAEKIKSYHAGGARLFSWFESNGYPIGPKTVTIKNGTHDLLSFGLRFVGWFDSDDLKNLLSQGQ